MDSTADISGPWLEIDLGAITHNLRQIQEISGDVQLMPVIKANAYGHGLEEVGLHLSRLGIYGLCVGSQNEALRLRNSGVSCPVLCFGPYTEKEAERAITNNIGLAVTRVEQPDMLNRVAESVGAQARVHVKIDTGLGRVGIPWEKALASLRKLHSLKNVNVEGIYTSLTEDAEIDNKQLARFADICDSAGKEMLATGYKHVSSSAHILSSEQVPFDLARPGIMIIGCYPSPFERRRRRIDLQPCLSWKTRIIDIKRLSAGEGVSYHHAYKASQNEMILIAGVGYSDGYPVQASQNGYVLVNGQRLPLVASVTANHIYIKAEKDTMVHAGDEVVLLGEQDDNQITLEEMAAWVKSSEYQVASSLNPLLPRYYLP